MESSGVLKTTLAIFLSPTIGMLVAILLVAITSWLFSRIAAKRADWTFRKLQLVSAALDSLGHGANDAQKTMGIIAVLLFSHGYLGSEFYVPFWVVLPARRRWGSAR